MDDHRPDGFGDYAVRVIEHKARELGAGTSCARADEEDLEQELYVHLCERISQFNPTIACLATFVARIVDHKAASIVRHRRAQKRDPAREQFSLDARDASPNGHQIGNGESYTRKDLASHLRAILDELPEPDRSVAFELGTGTLASAARKFGLSRAQARTIKARIRQRLEHRGLDDSL